jgi:predicted DsbA family dithiol-disulfide isomerase
MHKLAIDVWSDIACPWCYVGKRRLEAALAEFPHRAAVELTWRSFELDPTAPRSQPVDPPYTTRLARKYGTDVAQAEAMIQRMTGVAAADGLEMRFDIIRPGNTLDAHRLLHLARDRHLQDSLKERLFRAYLCEGRAIGEPDVLAALAVEVGLDAGEVQHVLASDAYATEVRADEREATALGIRGVPFFVFGPRHAVSGAQPSAALLEALTRAWSELGTDTLIDGQVCGVDGCT